jgi:hypothetical protein
VYVTVLPRDKLPPFWVLGPELAHEHPDGYDDEVYRMFARMTANR